LSKKVLHHPDKDEIIRRLNDGESIRTTAAWIKQKYKNNKSLQVSTVTLQQFRKQHLNLDGKVLKDIQEVSKTQKKQLEEQVLQKQLEASNAYQEKINEIAGSRLDVGKRILQLDRVIESRIEHYYNLALTGELPAGKADRELRDFIDRAITLLEKYKKYVEGMADHTVDYNVNITVMNDQISVIRNVVREIISEMDADVAMRFMDKFNSKLTQLSYRPQDTSSGIDIAELQALDIKFLEDGEEDGP